MKRIIEFKGNDYSDLYWFNDKTNEREFIKTIKMNSDVITSEELSAVRQLGYKENVTYCEVFNWFRERWGYVAWIEKSGKEYGYKIYANGVFHRPKEETKYPYCKNHEEAQVKLLGELIKVVEERENLT